MFTGIITHTGTITDAKQQGDLRIAIACPFAAELKIGESVAVNGACLTVVEKNKDSFSADLSEETVSRTATSWQKGSKVNLEHSLKLGDALDGHLVTGHVDGAAIITDIISPPPAGGSTHGSHILKLSAPKELALFIAEKGSVTLDGVSLTVNKVEGACFWVNIIPHTWRHTTLGERKAGDAVNLEIDLMARYAQRLLST